MARTSARAAVAGELRQWHKVTLDFEGPSRGQDAGTFVNHRLDVTFRHASSGETITVPGYFAADGRAAHTSAAEGAVWRAHFNPPKAGDWTWEASFRTGDKVAVAAHAKAGQSGGHMDGATGALSVGSTNKSGGDLRGKGMLEYNGDSYLNFAGDGKVFLKSGVGSPENFLAYKGFDNTPASHEFKPHARHHKAGDPLWGGGEGKGIIGAVNYLADQGVNSSYIILNTVGGDGQDVWPWAATGLDRYKHNAASRSGTPNLTEEARAFDVSKLAQWEIVFEHMQKKGIVLHLFFQETENDHILNDGDMGLERLLYYREMVARFGHHNGVIWNLGEENTNSAAQIKAQSAALKALDPYDHPVALHTYPTQHARYDAHRGSATLDVLSFQTSFDHQVPDLARYLGNAEKAGRPVVAFLDEPGNATVGAAAIGDRGWQANHDALRDTLWRFFSDGGSGAEWYFGYATAGGTGGDLRVEDFSTRESVYHWAAHARTFFEALPLEQMRDHDALTTNTNGPDQVLAKPGQVYAIYLPKGGSATLDLTGHSGTYKVTWFDPLSGAERAGTVASVSGGSKVSIGNAPFEAGREWAVRVEKTGAQTKPAPIGPIVKDEPVVTAPVVVQPPKEDPVATKGFKGTDPGVHLMKNGLVVMQAESGAFANPKASGNAAWKLKSDLAGYKGDGYLLFDTKTDYFNARSAGTDATGPLEYDFRVGGTKADAAGQYFISLRAMKPVTGEPSDRNNDVYVAVSKDGEDPGAWKKVFFSGGANQWLWGTTYDVNHKKSPASFSISEPGDYTIHVSGRSRQAGLDEIQIQKGSASKSHGAATSEIVKAGSKPAPEPVKPAPVVPDPAPEKPAPKPEPIKPEPEPADGPIKATNDGFSFTAGDVKMAGGKGTITIAKSALLANDSGHDGKIALLANAMGGTTALSKDGGSVSYTFDAGSFPGKGAFSYRIFDGAGGSDTGRAYLSVDLKAAAPSQPAPSQPAPTKPAPAPKAEGGTVTLVDAKTDKALVTLKGNAVIEAGSAAGLDLSMAAEHAAKGVKSAEMLLGGRVVRVENEAPYALFGDLKGDYFGGGLGLKAGSSITLGARFFDQANAKGQALGTAEAKISVQNGTLKGKSGADDVFVFNPAKMGRDTIQGFEDGDQIALMGSSLSARAVANLAKVSGGDTVLDFGGGNVLTIKDVTDFGLDDILA